MVNIINFTRKYWLILLVSITLLTLSFIKVSFFSSTINLFNISCSKHSSLEEVWDYVIIDNPDKSGRNKWEIGLTDNKINIYETASAPVVQQRVFKKIDMNYTSMEDYYKNGGPDAFRKFIEGHNK